MKSLLLIDADGSSSRDFSRMLPGEYCVTHSPSILDALGLLNAGHVYDRILCVREGQSQVHVYDLTRELTPVGRPQRPAYPTMLDDFEATIRPQRMPGKSDYARAYGRTDHPASL